MASSKNDQLLTRTVDGSYNHYDGQRCCGSAFDKGLAARLGGHSYNILNNQDTDEVHLKHLRHDDHFLDNRGRHTTHFFGDRRRKFGVDERNHMFSVLTGPDAHPRDRQLAQRRTELQLAQMENSGSWSGFQKRTASLDLNGGKRRYTISNKMYANEAEKMNPKNLQKGNWLQRRGEDMTHAASCPSLQLSDPSGSLHRAVSFDTRKEATQRQTESAHFAPWMSHNTYVSSLEGTPAGRAHSAAQQHCSVHRLENHDFGISRKNNHYSSQDKLTRADPYFMRPRLGMTNNSVKYDIISNERRWFKY